MILISPQGVCWLPFMLLGAVQGEGCPVASLTSSAVVVFLEHSTIRSLVNWACSCQNGQCEALVFEGIEGCTHFLDCCPSLLFVLQRER